MHFQGEIRVRFRPRLGSSRGNQGSGKDPEKYLIEEDFNCDHLNGCSFHCTHHLKKSCESLADGLRLIVPNPGFKNYEIPIFDAETYGFLAKYEIKPIEKILHEMYLIPLQFVIENITEISEAKGFKDTVANRKLTQIL